GRGGRLRGRRERLDPRGTRAPHAGHRPGAPRLLVRPARLPPAPVSLVLRRPPVAPPAALGGAGLSDDRLRRESPAARGSVLPARLRGPARLLRRRGDRVGARATERAAAGTLHPALLL